MQKPALILALASMIGILTAADKMKPWTEWTEKDAEKILNNSAWGQTQIETNTTEMNYSPGRTPARDAEGAYNQATTLNLHIRFLSARPVRQAFARLIHLRQNPDEKAKAALQEFIDRKFDEWIVVSITYDSRDGRLQGPAMQSFSSANTGLLKNSTYLERKDGKRQFLDEYKPPSSSGLGAQFFFKRIVDGQPFLDLDAVEVRFYSEVLKNTKINMRYRIKDMTFDGKLEF